MDLRAILWLLLPDSLDSLLFFFFCREKAAGAEQQRLSLARLRAFCVPLSLWGVGCSWLPWDPGLVTTGHPALPSPRAAAAAWAVFALMLLHGSQREWRLPQQPQYQGKHSPLAHTAQGFVIHQEPNHSSKPVFPLMKSLCEADLFVAVGILVLLLSCLGLWVRAGCGNGGG